MEEPCPAGCGDPIALSAAKVLELLVMAVVLSLLVELVGYDCALAGSAAMLLKV